MSINNPKSTTQNSLELDKDLYQINKLMEMSVKYNRKLLFIYDSYELASNMNLINTQIKLEPCSLVSKDSIWQILIEYSDEKNICNLHNIN